MTPGDDARGTGAANPAGTSAGIRVDDHPVERRFGRRIGARVFLGGGVGAVIGALAGWGLAAAFGAGTGARWAAVIAGALFVSALGAFWAGMSALEPARPGLEPAESASLRESPPADADDRSRGLVVDESEPDRAR
jgi:MFS family permease